MPLLTLTLLTAFGIWVAIRGIGEMWTGRTTVKTTAICTVWTLALALWSWVYIR